MPTAVLATLQVLLLVISSLALQLARTRAMSLLSTNESTVKLWHQRPKLWLTPHGQPHCLVSNGVAMIGRRVDCDRSGHRTFTPKLVQPIAHRALKSDDAAHRYPTGKYALDCRLRSLAHRFAMSMRPDGGQVIADGLELSSMCNVSDPPAGTQRRHKRLKMEALQQRATALIDAARFRVRVVANGSSRVGRGIIATSTVAHGLAILRAARDRGAAKNVKGDTETASSVLVLGSGLHFVPNTIHLTASDSHLAIVSEPGSIAILSGGQDLGQLVWRQAGRDGLFSAQLPSSIGVFDSLYQPDGRRAIRARFPNADPESSNPGINGICFQADFGRSRDGINCPGWIPSQRNKPPTTWHARAPLSSPVYLDRVTSPARANSSDFANGTIFPFWQLGKGGPLDGIFEPPASFW